MEPLTLELMDGGCTRAQQTLLDGHPHRRGQPARGTEILSVLVRNCQNGQRGLFALPGGLATVISYNKVRLILQWAGRLT